MSVFTLLCCTWNIVYLRIRVYYPYISQFNFTVSGFVIAISDMFIVKLWKYCIYISEFTIYYPYISEFNFAVFGFVIAISDMFIVNHLSIGIHIRVYYPNTCISKFNFAVLCGFFMVIFEIFKVRHLKTFYTSILYPNLTLLYLDWVFLYPNCPNWNIYLKTLGICTPEYINLLSEINFNMA